MTAAAVQGLSSREAEERLQKFGPNEPAPPRGQSRLVQLLSLFLNPLVIILLVAATAEGVLGQVTDAGIIVAVVLTGVAINFIQTYRSQDALERLRNRVTPTATVQRDNAWREIRRQELVPGDVIRLSAGDLVPADACLVESRDLYVQQAALTGESMPVEKEATAAPESAQPDAPNMVFLGTSVVSGIATARIVTTGARTAFGAIASRLAVRPEETSFERDMRRFGNLIMRAVFFLVLFILAVSIALHHDALQSLLFAVALAVGLTPEFMPMITSVTLAKGATRMAREKVIVKQLGAIQNLGTIDVICSDKTGTITAGIMSLEKIVGPSGEPSERSLTLGYINSQFDTGIRSPLDSAILQHACPAAQGYEKVDEIPFDFVRRRLSVVVSQASTHTLITKGAPEGILELCVSYEKDGPPGEGRKISPFDEESRKRSRAVFDDLGRQGFRVLAVADREVPAQARYSAGDEQSLTLVGFLAFADPLLPDACDALTALRNDGVQVKILTGDNELVTCHICAQAGLDSGTPVLGDDLERMGDSALGHVVENNTVFARLSPAQKNRIILALKHRSHVVGYMGDGINDAPSLHAADVGISVSSAVDVARDAADIVLVEPGLRVLHNGILEGRKASANVMKYILMGTSSNFGNMLSMAAASLFLPFLPMLPTQILLNNFLYDTAQVTIPTDNVDPDYVKQPRAWDMRVIRNFMVLIGPISSLYDFLTFFVLLHFFHASQPLFHTGWFVESLATQTLVLFVIRTQGNPLRSRPSGPLTFTTLAIVFVGVVLPFIPFLARPLGLTPLPAPYFGFLAIATITYLLLVQVAKRVLRSELSARVTPASAEAAA